MPAKPVIITCAVTGSIHTPSMSPYLPITPTQIADEAVAAAEAGASVLHLHARDPEDGRPTADPAVFAQFLPRIAQQTDAVINITTGGAPGMSLDERLAGPLQISPEMASLNMGTINGGRMSAGNRITKYKYEWERQFLNGGNDRLFKNTFADIERIVTELGKGHGTRFEFECYDLGHLYNIAWLLDEKHCEPPLFIQFVLGMGGGVGAEVDNLLHMFRTAERLFGDVCEFSVLGIGRHQMPMANQMVLLGGNVRVGLEDSLTIAPRTLAKSNAEQVGKVRRIIEELSMPIATPAEARERLQLKGADRTRVSG